MQVPSTSAYSAGSAPSVAAAPTQLRGRALAAARIVLVAVAALALTILAVSVPTRYHQLRTLAATGLGDSWTTEQARAALAAAGVPVAVHAASIVSLDILFVVVFFAVAAVLAARRSDERIALFVAIFLVAFSVNWTTETAWWVGTIWYVPVKILNLFSWIGFTGFFFLFPDGRFAPGWMRPLALGWIAASVLVDTFVQLPQPIVLLLWLAGLGLCLFAQVYRFRRISGPIERQQTKWVVFGFAVPFALVLLLVLAGVLFPAIEQPGAPGFYYASAGRLLTYSLFGSLPLSLCVAILRYRLWDIDILINRALVYSALTLLIVALYVLIVGGLGALLQAQGNLLVSLVGAGLIAVLFQPLRARLQLAVNRLMFGERDDPYAALSRLGRRLDATPAPDAVLPTLADAIREALKLPYVAIALRQGEQMVVAAETNDRVTSWQGDKGIKEMPSPPHPLTLSLSYQGEPIGELRLATRPGEDSFSAADQRLLADLARQAGAAAQAVRLHAHAVDLAGALQRSRERLVTAREEERRRLRRDLHDGLGSTLAGLNLQAGALRSMIAHDPAAADALAVELRADIRSAIADIRRLAYDLRPPALDELGLLGAIRARAAYYASGQHGEHDLRIDVEAPDELPPLPAAVEVASYRIVQEALANVAHHAHARTCVIRLAISDRLHLEIVDDGVGLAGERRTGVGLVSMRERAAELGGACTVEPASGAGTRVRAWLPLLDKVTE